jgi:hypothetical protein
MVTVLSVLHAVIPSRPACIARRGQIGGALSRRRRSVLDQFEGGIYQRVGKTRLEWFRWGVEFAQADVLRLTAKDERARCLELALFVCAATGIGPRRTKTDIQMPSGKEMREAKTELGGLLEKIRLRQPISVPSPERTLRWVETWEKNWAKTLTMEPEEVNAGEVTERKVKASKRYVMFVESGWVNGAKSHFCELAAKFGDELRKCEAPGVCKTRWFLPKVKTQRFCSTRCQQRFTTSQARAKKAKEVQPDGEGPAK